MVTRASFELPSAGTVQRGRLNRLDMSSSLLEQCWCPRSWTCAFVPSYFTGIPAQPAPRAGFGLKKANFVPSHLVTKHCFSLSSLLPLSAWFVGKSQQRIYGEQIQSHSPVSLAACGVVWEASFLCCNSSPLPSLCLREKTCCCLLVMALNELSR